MWRQVFQETAGISICFASGDLLFLVTITMGKEGCGWAGVIPRD